MSLDVYLSFMLDTGAEPEEITVYESNITHNLNTMAKEAKIYDILWHPPEICLAKRLIRDLEKGLGRLKDNPEYFKKFNPPNGWGSYEGFVSFVSNYLDACKKYPKSSVKIWG